MKGLVRGLFTLAGVVAAGLLVWLASFFNLGETGEFWAAMGLMAAAGFSLGLSQLLGGWTKWGWPRFSPGVFLLGFLPTLVLAGGILLATRPTGVGTEERVRGWADDLGIGGLVGDFAAFPGILAFTLGLVFAFVFDTTGPRTQVVERERDLAGEDVRGYRRDETVATTPTRGEVRSERSDVDDRTEVVPPERRTERVETRDPGRRETP